MKLFLSYLKSKKYIILLLLLFGLIFVVSFLLYHLPLMAVIYPFVLCLICGIGFMVVDFIKVWYKHREIKPLINLTAEMIDSLPDTKSIVEEDYKQLVLALQKQVLDEKEKSYCTYKDMIDYYTLWVHQIKNPIASLKLSLENQDSSFARGLSSDLLRIEQYVNMVLIYLRLDSDSTDYVFNEVSLDKLINQNIQKFASDFINKKIKLEYTKVNSNIITDEKWLSIVIEQIISNSVKYTYTGSVKIYSPEKDILCIEDTGIGIAKEDLPRIFEKGFTGTVGRKEKASSGIGLYLCKGICDKLNINIDVNSNVGKGTTVTLNLSRKTMQFE